MIDYRLSWANNTSWRWTRDLSAFATQLDAGAVVRMTVAFAGGAYTFASDDSGDGAIEIDGQYLAIFTAPLADLRAKKGFALVDCRIEMPDGSTGPMFTGSVAVRAGVTTAAADASSTHAEGIPDTVVVVGETDPTPVPMPAGLTAVLAACLAAQQAAEAAVAGLYSNAQIDAKDAATLASANDYADTLFAGVAQADWNATSGPAAILNKPALNFDPAGSAAAALASANSYTDATVAGKLAKASNLSDLADAAAARVNLGLGALATVVPGTGVAVAAANALNAASGLLGLNAGGNIAPWGSTSSFPMVKRNGAALNFRLADDSADAAITVGALTANGISNIGNGSFVVHPSSIQLGAAVWSTWALGWSTSPGSTNIDAAMYRDAANIIAQRNGVNAQAKRVYNTFTDASNYERGVFDWKSVANVLTIGTENAGTGSARAMNLRTGGTDRWQVSTSGHFLAVTDNAYDIGTQVANRPRDIFVARNGEFAGNVKLGFLRLNGHTRVYGVSGGSITLYNETETDFSRLQFGGTTASFPALKRSTTALQARLADDSAFTFIQGKHQTDTAYATGAVVATGYLTLYDSTGTAYRVLCAV